MKKIFTLLIILSSLISCVQENAADVTPEDGNKIMVNVAVDGLTETKSVITVPENGISDITLFFFLDGKLNEAVYSVPNSDGSVLIESSKQYLQGASVDVYGVVNMGDMSKKFNLGTESSYVKENFRDTLPQDAQDLNSTGFPMSGCELNVPVGQAFTLNVQRLFAKYGFKINTTNIKYGTFRIESLKLKNSAKSVAAFKQSKVTQTSDVFESYDYATASNLSSLNSGTGVYFYTLENCQGTLLSGNTDPWKKIPANIGNNADLCTFIELTGTYTDNSGGMTATHTYRMYLGQDNVTNFDVVRNTRYEYTLTLSDEGALKANWKAERDIIDDARQFQFAQDYEVEYDQDCIVTLNTNTPNMGACTFKLSQNLIDAKVTFDPDYMVLRQGQKLNNHVDGTLTATSWDGVHTATCNVRALKYQPKDIVVIIKPASISAGVLASQSSPIAVDLKLATADANTGTVLQYIETEDEGWEILYEDNAMTGLSTNGKSIFTVSNVANNQVHLSAIQSGKAKVYARYTNTTNGTKYENSSDDIDFPDDRTATIKTVSEPVLYSRGEYKVTRIDFTTNFGGSVIVGGEDFETRIVSVEKGQTKYAYLTYVGDNVNQNAEVTIKTEDGQTLASSSVEIRHTVGLTITDLSTHLHAFDTDENWDLGIGTVSASEHFDWNELTPLPQIWVFEGREENTIYGTIAQWTQLQEWYRENNYNNISLVVPEMEKSVSCGHEDFAEVLSELIKGIDTEMKWDSTVPGVTNSRKEEITCFVDIYPTTYSNGKYQTVLLPDNNQKHHLYVTCGWDYDHDVNPEPIWLFSANKGTRYTQSINCEHEKAPILAGKIATNTIFTNAATGTYPNLTNSSNVTFIDKQGNENTSSGPVMIVEEDDTIYKYVIRY